MIKKSELSKDLFEAHASGNIDKIKSLVLKNVPFTLEVEPSIQEFIVQVADKGDLLVLKFIHEQGLKLDFEKSVLLLVAASEGRVNIMEYLLNNGLNLNTLDQDTESSALDHAIKYNKLVAANYLVDKGIDVSLSHYKAIRHALNENYPDLIIKIIEKHNLNLNDDYLGRTLIEGSVKKNNLNLFKYVYSKQKRKNILNKNNLSWCATYKADKILQYLISNGANPEDALNNKLVPLFKQHKEFLAPYIKFYQEKKELDSIATASGKNKKSKKTVKL